MARHQLQSHLESSIPDLDLERIRVRAAMCWTVEADSVSHLTHRHTYPHQWLEMNALNEADSQCPRHVCNMKRNGLRGWLKIGLPATDLQASHVSHLIASAGNRSATRGSSATSHYCRQSADVCLTSLRYQSVNMRRLGIDPSQGPSPITWQLKIKPGQR